MNTKTIKYIKFKNNNGVIEVYLKQEFKIIEKTFYTIILYINDDVKRVEFIKSENQALEKYNKMVLQLFQFDNIRCVY